MKRSNQGFTLIELIIVIVILGILAVTASPKFLDLQGDARGATVEGVEASLKGAVNIAYSKALIQGVTGTTAAPVAMTNPAIEMVFGYPDASNENIADLLELDAGEWEYYTVGTESRIYPLGAYEGASNTVFTDDGPEGDDSTGCYVTYTEAADANSVPTIDIKTDGC